MDHTESQGELTTAAGFRVDDELAGLKPRPEDEAPSHYEQKQKARRHRLERAADNAEAEAAAVLRRHVARSRASPSASRSSSATTPKDGTGPH